jgi:hypothetical protein
MNTASNALMEPQFSTVQSGNCLDALRQIRFPEVQAVLWPRQMDADLRAELECLVRNKAAVAVDIRGSLTEGLREQLAEKLGALGRQIGSPLSSLRREILQLAQVFQEVVHYQPIRIRLERVEDDACALFHTDSVRFRLLCTYRGPGTQWLVADELRYAELGMRDRSLEEANHAIIRNPAEIRQLEEGEVALFKGRAWPGEESGWIHRSAPLAKSEVRLRLCLDVPN